MSMPDDEMHKWTDEQIADVARRETGFTAASCSCGKTANVRANDAQWWCPCGKWNTLDWYERQIPHEKPDFGPTLARITEIVERVRSRG